MRLGVNPMGRGTRYAARICGLVLLTAASTSMAAPPAETSTATDGKVVADEVEPDPDIETIEVIAPAWKRSSTATLVEQEELQTQNTFVAYDALKFKTGLHSVQRMGLTGSGLSRLTLRGLGADGPAGLVVLVDGRPDATVSFAHPTPSAMNLANVASLEVIHGPSPVLYGSGLVGVVNIRSARPEDGLSGFIRGSFGQFDTVETLAQVAYGGDIGFVRVSGSYQETAGYLEELSARVLNLNVRAGLDLGDHWQVTVGGGINEDSFGVFGNFFVPGPFTDPRTEGLDLTQTAFDANLTGRYDDFTASLTFFLDHLNPRSQVLDPPEERADVMELGVRAKVEGKLWDSTVVTVGSDALYASANNSPVLPPFAGPMLSIPRDRLAADLWEVGAYLFVQHEFNEYLEAQGGVRLITHTAYSPRTAEELGLIWRITGLAESGPAIRVRYTRGYQSPTLQQLFGIFRAGVDGPANPNLGPERMHQAEVGLNWRDSWWSFDVVGFLQDGSGLISRPATPPPPPPDIENEVDFTNYGVESRLTLTPLSGLDFYLGFTHLELDLEDRFVRVPRTTADVAISYVLGTRRPDDLSLFVTGRYALGIKDVADGQVVDLDDYLVIDAHARYDVFDFFGVILSLDNITDANYQLAAGVPARPLMFSGGLILQL